MRKSENHNLMVWVALLALIVFTGYGVVHSGLPFDPESFGIGTGSLIFGGVATGTGLVMARKWRTPAAGLTGSAKVDSPDGQR